LVGQIVQVWINVTLVIDDSDIIKEPDDSDIIKEPDDSDIITEPEKYPNHINCTLT